LVAANGLPLTVLLALDYDTGQIVNQTRFPSDFSGGSGLCRVIGDSIYISTLGVQISSSSYHNNACIARFDQHLHCISAKQIIGAEGRFPIVFNRSPGVNLLSYYFYKTQRGAAAAVDDNLQSVDTPCSWIEDLHLAMAQCSYKTGNAESREENLEVVVTDVTARTQPAEIKIAPLDLHITPEGGHKNADR